MLQEFKRETVRKLSTFLCIGWAGEAAWTVAFAANTTASVTICAGLLLTSCAAFLAALRDALPLRPGAFEYSCGPMMRHVLVASIAINAAWLSVATTLGMLVAVSANNPGADLEAAGIALAVLAAMLGAAVALAGSCASYPLTLAWAFTGVATKDGSSDTVTVVAWVCVAAMLVVSIVAVLLRGLRAPRDRAAKDPALADATELQYAAPEEP